MLLDFNLIFISISTQETNLEYNSLTMRPLKCKNFIMYFVFWWFIPTFVLLTLRCRRVFLFLFVCFFFLSSSSFFSYMKMRKRFFGPQALESDKLTINMLESQIHQLYIRVQYPWYFQNHFKKQQYASVEGTTGISPIHTF